MRWSPVAVAARGRRPASGRPSRPGCRADGAGRSGARPTSSSRPSPSRSAAARTPRASGGAERLRRPRASASSTRDAASPATTRSSAPLLSRSATRRRAGPGGRRPRGRAPRPAPLAAVCQPCPSSTPARPTTDARRWSRARRSKRPSPLSRRPRSRPAPFGKPRAGAVSRKSPPRRFRKHVHRAIGVEDAASGTPSPSRSAQTKPAQRDDARKRLLLGERAVAVVAEDDGRPVDRGDHDVEIAVGVDVGRPGAEGRRARARRPAASSAAVTSAKRPPFSCRSRAQSARAGQHEVGAEVVVEVGGQDAVGARRPAGRRPPGNGAARNGPAAMRTAAAGRQRSGAPSPVSHTGAHPAARAGSASPRARPAHREGERLVGGRPAAASGLARARKRRSGSPTSSRGVLTAASARRYSGTRTRTFLGRPRAVAAARGLSAAAASSAVHCSWASAGHAAGCRGQGARAFAERRRVAALGRQARVVEARRAGSRTARERLEHALRLGFVLGPALALGLLGEDEGGLEIAGIELQRALQMARWPRAACRGGSPPGPAAAGWARSRGASSAAFASFCAAGVGLLLAHQQQAEIGPARGLVGHDA